MSGFSTVFVLGEIEKVPIAYSVWYCHNVGHVFNKVF